jgi:DNA-binding protein Fis
MIGTAMDYKKRQQLGLNGLLPARVETLDVQKNRALRVLRSKEDPLEKYILMAQLRTTNVRLFYKIVIDELEVSFLFFIAPVSYSA